MTSQSSTVPAPGAVGRAAGSGPAPWYGCAIGEPPDKVIKRMAGRATASGRGRGARTVAKARKGCRRRVERWFPHGSAGALWPPNDPGDNRLRRTPATFRSRIRHPPVLIADGGAGCVRSAVGGLLLGVLDGLLQVVLQA